MNTKTVLAFVLAVALSGCVSLTTKEEDMLYELEQYGIYKPEQKTANPVIAGALNLLPGFGNFYLANGKGADDDQWGYGALNLVTWPISIFWGVPEAIIDANTINKREMVKYFRLHPEGKFRLKKYRNEYQKEVASDEGLRPARWTEEQYDR